MAFLYWFLPSAARMVNVAQARCLSTSTACFMRRPVFDSPTFPKKPLSSYMLFVKDTRSTITSNEDNKDITKQIAEKWQLLSVNEKQSYIDRSDELKKLYKSEVENFLSSLGDDEQQKKYLEDLAEYRRQKRAYIKHCRLKRKGLVKPGPISGYNVFMMDHRNEFVERQSLPEDLKIGMKAMNEKWHTLSFKEKESYNARGKAMYAQKLAEYEVKYLKAIEEGEIKEKKRTPQKKEGSKDKDRIS